MFMATVCLKGVPLPLAARMPKLVSLYRLAALTVQRARLSLAALPQAATRNIRVEVRYGCRRGAHVSVYITELVLLDRLAALAVEMAPLELTAMAQWRNYKWEERLYTTTTSWKPILRLQTC